ncbi:MAG: acetyltransferase [Polyangiaceae bacterium]|nr:acetyltransferase [Polyangiaceae bacterium]
MKARDQGRNQGCEPLARSRGRGRAAPRRRRSLGRLAAVLFVAVAPACMEAVSVDEPAPAGELAVGQSRAVELEFLRFDAKKFAKTLTLEDLKEIPRSTLENTWLLDLDLTTLIKNSLLRLTYLPPAEAAEQSRAAQNLVSLLGMTPESANLAGTSLAGLLGVGNAVGLPPSKILAELVQVGPNDTLISTDMSGQAVMTNLVTTHPNTQRRLGPPTAEHPDGVFPVAPHSIPVTLYDVVSDFAGLAERYGPVPLDPAQPAGPKHPGFIKYASPVKAAGEAFAMTVQVNVNALPYKGVDLTSGAGAAVNSILGQVDEMFDFSDPNWLILNGLSSGLSIGELTMVIGENPAYLPGGTNRAPLPLGDSPVWATPTWEFEHILADAGKLRGAQIAPHCTTYAPRGTSEEPFDAVEVCIDETGWVEIKLDPSVILDTPAPVPSYFWDVLVEVAQRRLHDGSLAEGEANLELTVRDVPVGIETAELVASIKANITQNPSLLKDMAVELNDNAAGDADFFYYQPSTPSGVAGRDDYLYFVAPEDIRKDEAGARVRPYAYKSPGFYADAGFTSKVSSKALIDGDDQHEKVKIEPGTSVFMEDDAGRRFEIKAGAKPSPHRVALTVTRVQ